MKVTTVISIFTAVAAAAVTGQDMRNKNNEDMVARDVQMQEAEQANAPKMATTPLVLPIPTSIPSFSKPVPTILPSKTLPMTAPTSTMKPSSNGSNAASLGKSHIYSDTGN